MQSLVDLVKFMTLALKVSDPELKAMRYVDVRLCTKFQPNYPGEP